MRARHMAIHTGKTVTQNSHAGKTATASNLVVVLNFPSALKIEFGEFSRWFIAQRNKSRKLAGTNAAKAASAPAPAPAPLPATSPTTLPAPATADTDLKLRIPAGGKLSLESVWKVGMLRHPALAIAEALAFDTSMITGEENRARIMFLPAPFYCMQEVDADASGFLDRAEVKQLFIKLRQERLVNDEKRLNKAFKQLDTDNSGKVRAHHHHHHATTTT
eukprot:SAG11_NODE_9717_length_886_cov_1.559085_1_plen_218_part_10